MGVLANTNLLADIRSENLRVYRSSPQRLREDVGQESQIAQDYKGRLIYELLQNADDAMEASDADARVYFRLSSDSLWVANSGKPLDDADVRGLCGISASSKLVQAKKRASIGHKGMGFKSVLEICDAPEVYSTTASFRFSAQDALTKGRQIARRRTRCRSGETRADVSVPLGDRGRRQGVVWVSRQRVPHSIPISPAGQGQAEQHARLQIALKALPVSSLLFLKRLQHVEIEVIDEPHAEHIEWVVQRQLRGRDGSTSRVSSLSESGVYTVSLSNGQREAYSFVVAYSGEIPIGNNRSGLNEEVASMSLYGRMLN